MGGLLEKPSQMDVDFTPKLENGTANEREWTLILNQ
jgi:hypothetical protein